MAEPIELLPPAIGVDDGDGHVERQLDNRDGRAQVVEAVLGPMAAGLPKAFSPAGAYSGDGAA
jgi:hypothetical protein